jgi:apolipoprotein N-acyltransferase
MSDFSDGDSVLVSLSIAGQLIAPSICYEIIFPEEIIQLLPEANLLVNVSNDAWFGDSLAPHQHLQMTRMRALETGRWILRATNTGITALIDDGGNIQSQAPRFKTAVLTGEVQSRSGATPYVRFGNWPVLILIGGILLLVVLLARREEQ